MKSWLDSLSLLPVREVVRSAALEVVLVLVLRPPVGEERGRGGRRGEDHRGRERGGRGAGVLLLLLLLRLLSLGRRGGGAGRGQLAEVCWGA